MALADFFAAYPPALLIFALLLGLVVGSFLNVVIYRLPLMMERDWTLQCLEFLDIADSEGKLAALPTLNLARPGSHCPGCQHEISAVENIPIFSYLIQAGKCRHCKAPISARYPIIETVTGLFSLLVAYEYGFTWLALCILVLAWSLIVLTMIDFDHQLLPDDITLPLLWLGLIVNYFELITTLEAAVLGAIAGYLILWAVYWLFKLLTGKEGMGQGDFKLLAALGAWMGWQSLPQIILLSALAGAIVGIALIVLKGRDKNIPIPYGPYLAGAGCIALVWGDQVNQLYAALF